MHLGDAASATSPVDYEPLLRDKVLEAGSPHRCDTYPVGGDAERLSSLGPGREVSQTKSECLAISRRGGDRWWPRPAVVVGDHGHDKGIGPSKWDIDPSHVSGPDCSDESVVSDRPRDEPHRAEVPVELTGAGLVRIRGQVDAQGFQEDRSIGPCGTSSRAPRFGTSLPAGPRWSCTRSASEAVPTRTGRGQLDREYV